MFDELSQMHTQKRKDYLLSFLYDYFMKMMGKLVKCDVILKLGKNKTLEICTFKTS